MKKIILTALIVISSVGLFAIPKPPSSANPGGDGTGHGLNGSQGQGAPLDGGLSILMVLGAAYGAKKVHRFKKKDKE